MSAMYKAAVARGGFRMQSYVFSSEEKRKRSRLYLTPLPVAADLMNLSRFSERLTVFPMYYSGILMYYSGILMYYAGFPMYYVGTSRIRPVVRKSRPEIR